MIVTQYGFSLFSVGGSFLYAQEIIIQQEQVQVGYLPLHLGTPAIYIAVLKSIHRTATVCSSICTFFRGSKLLTVAVLWTLAKTANHGSSMDTFRSFQKVQFCDRISTTPKSVHKTSTVCSFRSQL